MELRYFFALIILNLSIEWVIARNNHTFPDGFLIGTASSAYQVEGAWNTNGKGPSIWDNFTHEHPYFVVDRSNGDVAADSYHKYNEDIDLLNEIGVDHYRLSLSWPRILPNGFSNRINRDGIDYYKRILNGLREKNIEPVVTLYHWDHPQILEEMGGWTNELIVEWFADYSRIVFRELGDKIKYIATINEPIMICEGYAGTEKAPGKKILDIGKYICLQNILKAHATAYHIYDEEFRAKQGGKVGIVIPCPGMFPKTEQDTEATDTGYQYICGLVAHPIYSKNGDYPEVIKTRIGENSKLQGYAASRLPELSQRWIQYIKGSYDYFGLNHYSSFLVEAVPKKNGSLWYNDCGVKLSFDPKWPTAASSWLKVVPEGFAWTLNKIRTEYENPPVYVMENGYSDTGELQDHKRIDYLQSYMKSMLKAMYQDGCDVRGYTVWSILDNFEWERGYTEKFGIVNVDFNDTNRPRKLKLSALWLKNVIRARRLEPIIDAAPIVLSL
ncbi:myrosinase 1-like [Prorops nasuta]|uniref:myrosinase 1-like n=1 Tax=Prorops nasuta TaxID=863751 RepID=UPI0034CEBBFC